MEVESILVTDDPVSEYNLWYNDEDAGLVNEYLANIGARTAEGNPNCIISKVIRQQQSLFLKNVDFFEFIEVMEKQSILELLHNLVTQF